MLAPRNRPRPSSSIVGRVASFENAIVGPSVNRGLETSCRIEDDDEDEDDYEPLLQLSKPLDSGSRLRRSRSPPHLTKPKLAYLVYLQCLRY